MIRLSTAFIITIHHTTTPPPHHHHHTNKYKALRLTKVDLCEIASNSVRISAFDPRVKAGWLGPNYHRLPFPEGNHVERSGVPPIRVQFRFESLFRELSYVLRKCGGVLEVGGARQCTLLRYGGVRVSENAHEMIDEDAFRRAQDLAALQTGALTKYLRKLRLRVRDQIAKSDGSRKGSRSSVEDGGGGGGAGRGVGVNGGGGGGALPAGGRPGPGPVGREAARAKAQADAEAARDAQDFKLHLLVGAGFLAGMVTGAALLALVARRER